MKKTLTNYEIAHELLQDENAAWTRAGAFALAEHLEQIEEDTGEEMELDIVAIRCDFAEYSSLEDWADDYGMEQDSLDDSHEQRADNIRSFIQDNGQLIEFDGGIIVSSF
jgi:hypothetical protein